MNLTCITAIVVIVIAIATDLWLDWQRNKGKIYFGKKVETWSQYVLRRAHYDKWFVIIFGVIFGILLTHFFWPKGKAAFDSPLKYALIGLAAGILIGTIWRQKKKG